MANRALRAFLDTHAAVFLWEGRGGIWGDGARRIIETSNLMISPVVRLEMKLLREVGKVTIEPETIMAGLEADCGVACPDDSLEAVVERAMGLEWTRDPFDRMIVATAMLHGAVLVTRDRRILDHYERAVW